MVEKGSCVKFRYACTAVELRSSLQPITSSCLLSAFSRLWPDKNQKKNKPKASSAGQNFLFATVIFLKADKQGRGEVKNILVYSPPEEDYASKPENSWEWKLQCHSLIMKTRLRKGLPSPLVLDTRSPDPFLDFGFFYILFRIRDQMMCVFFDTLLFPSGKKENMLKKRDFIHYNLVVLKAFNWQKVENSLYAFFPNGH